MVWLAIQPLRVSISPEPSASRSAGKRVQSTSDANTGLAGDDSRTLPMHTLTTTEMQALVEQINSLSEAMARYPIQSVAVRRSIHDLLANASLTRLQIAARPTAISTSSLGLRGDAALAYEAARNRVYNARAVRNNMATTLAADAAAELRLSSLADDATDVLSGDLTELETLHALETALELVLGMAMFRKPMRIRIQNVMDGLKAAAGM